MKSKLADFPLEVTGYADKPRETVILGFPGWDLTVGDVLDARRSSPQWHALVALCVEYKMPTHGTVDDLAARVRERRGKSLSNGDIEALFMTHMTEDSLPHGIRFARAVLRTALGDD
jgi:hypothetical protein